MNTKRYLILLIIGLWLSMIVHPVYAKENLSAYQIMKNVEDRIIPQDMTSNMKMNLVDKAGKIRSRGMKTYRMSDDKQIMWFLDPADVKGSSFLRMSYDDRDDDMWIYLPAFGKVRRIVSNAKTGTFMGSDFTYEDMGDRNLNDYNYKLSKQEKVNGKDCWVVESTPKSGVTTDYSKIISWIWQDEFTDIKEEYYDKKGNLKKVKTTELQKVSKYWIPTKISMKDVKTNHRTDLNFSDVRVDTGLKKDVFDTSHMTRVY